MMRSIAPASPVVAVVVAASASPNGSSQPTGSQTGGSPAAALK
jgi:hypothetical protein